LEDVEDGFEETGELGPEGLDEFDLDLLEVLNDFLDPNDLDPLNVFKVMQQHLVYLTVLLPTALHALLNTSEIDDHLCVIRLQILLLDKLRIGEDERESVVVIYDIGIGGI
jgi:hypothetical protein